MKTESGKCKLKHKRKHFVKVKVAVNDRLNIWNLNILMTCLFQLISYLCNVMLNEYGISAVQLFSFHWIFFSLMSTNLTFNIFQHRLALKPTIWSKQFVVSKVYTVVTHQDCILNKKATLMLGKLESWMSANAPT